MRTLVLVAGLALTASAQADVLDLRDGSGTTSGFLNGALFTTDFTQPAGSGVVDSFLRVQRANGQDTYTNGYNTVQANQPGEPGQRDEHPSDTFTHEITLGDLAVTTQDGVDYFRFILDINQEGSDPSLSLVEVQIRTRATAISQYEADLVNLGALVYDLDVGADGDSRVDLDFDHGSGDGDMAMLVPVSLFSGGPGTFVYLYSAFGGVGDEPPFQDNDGYQEWWHDVGVVIPLPGAGLAGLATFGGLFGFRASRRRR
jgi:hypothetical protein